MTEIRVEPNGLEIGKGYTNDEIVKFYRVGNMGGMRRSLKKNVLVIISDHTKMYEDRTEINSVGHEILHYTGMGKNGDQSLDASQNKTLKESNINGVEVVLFEKIDKNKNFIFMGPVKLIGTPYQERQLGENGSERNVWMFPLQILHEKVVISDSEIERLQQIKEDKAEKDSKNISMSQLEAFARRAKGKSARNTYTTTFIRDPFVTAFAKRRANGICDLCGQSAHFNDKKGNPYLECHHIHFLSKGGLDTIENVVALCVVCHKKQHIVESLEEKTYLLKKYDSNYNSPLQEVW